MNLRPTTLEEANAFVLQYHRHNKPTVGGRFSIGLESEGQLVGVAIVGRPVARQIEHHFTAEVIRVCTIPTAPPNAVSMLYAACWRAWRAMGGTRMVTYTLKTESGCSLRGAGWKVIAECRAGEWNSKSRSRESQPIYGQQKLRWEVTG